MTNLPPGPRWPKSVQTLAWWNRPLPFFEHCRDRYGKRFTQRLLGQPAFVHLSDPDEIKEIFTAPPDVLHPGKGAEILEPTVGRHSVILLDEDPHLEQRRLMLPAFHGERIARLTDAMRDMAEREAASWPTGEAIELHPRFQALTLEIILLTVFGLDAGERLDALRSRLATLLEWGSSPMAMLPELQRDLGPGSPGRRYQQLRSEIDDLVYALIEERRAEGADRDDVLSMFLEARHADDDSPMTREELRDELMTMLVAGHETTASELAWSFAELVRAPPVLATLTDEIRRGDGDAYRQGDGHRDPATPAGAAQRRAALRAQADHGRAAGTTRRASRWRRTPTSSTTTPSSIRAPTRSAPSASSTSSRGRTRTCPFGGGRRRCIGRELRDARDGDRPARRARAPRRARGGRRGRGRTAAEHHREPAPGCARRCRAREEGGRDRAGPRDGDGVSRRDRPREGRRSPSPPGLLPAAPLPTWGLVAMFIGRRPDSFTMRGDARLDPRLRVPVAHRRRARARTPRCPPAPSRSRGACRPPTTDLGRAIARW
jgi:cytochrome P450